MWLDAEHEEEVDTKDTEIALLKANLLALLVTTLAAYLIVHQGTIKA